MMAHDKERSTDVYDNGGKSPILRSMARQFNRDNLVQIKKISMSCFSYTHTTLPVLRQGNQKKISRCSQQRTNKLTHLNFIKIICIIYELR